MTTPTDEHPPLRTERDMMLRIRETLAPACHPSQLWVLLLDEAGYQSPVMIPIEDLPDVPDPQVTDALARNLGTVVAETLGGGGQVLFVLERMGPFGVAASDEHWAAAIVGSCRRADLTLAGLFLLSPGGVSSLNSEL